MKIFDIENGTKTDVTFAYDANFFLFATLEMARPIAHGRVAPQQTTIPVLTGMPVSGMAYLDRPSEAGYFIFPDLSVRHEGKYRLSFNLYEETKQEKDLDKEPVVDAKPKVPKDEKNPVNPESSFDWRMELKSDIFDVFSAKKFPGLAESTALSRTVAEQGCRVRIRRDVRMRRRGEGKGNDDYDEEIDYNRQSRAPTVDDFQRERSRSSSSGTEADPRVPYDPQHRSSGEWNQPGSHLAFGGQQAQQPFAAPQPPVQQTHYPPPGAYHQQPQYSQPAPPQHQYGYDRQYPQSAHPTYPARERMYAEEEWRRQSVAGHPNEQFQRHPPAAEHPFNRNPPPLQPLYSPPSPAQANRLPPFTSLTGKPESSPHVTIPSVRTLAPALQPALHSPTWERKEERPSLYSQRSGPLVPAPPPEAPRNGKRTFDSTFGSASSLKPLVNGMRPSSPHNDGLYDDDDNDADFYEQMKMSYKRADGSSYSRALPCLDNV